MTPQTRRMRVRRHASSLSLSIYIHSNFLELTVNFESPLELGARQLHPFERLSVELALTQHWNKAKGSGTGRGPPKPSGSVQKSGQVMNRYVTYTDIYIHIYIHVDF